MKAIEDLDSSACDTAAVAAAPRGVSASLAAAPQSAGGAITRAGFLASVDLCVRYLAARIGEADTAPPGSGSDAAESARVKLWHWLHGDAVRLEDGTPVDFALFDEAIQRAGERLPRRGLPGQEHLMRAAWLLAELTHAPTLMPPAAAGA